MDMVYRSADDGLQLCWNMQLCCETKKKLSVHVVLDGCSLLFDLWKQASCCVSVGMSQDIVCVCVCVCARVHACIFCRGQSVALRCT